MHKHTKMKWSPKYGGCIMMMNGNKDCCSSHEGEFPNREDGKRYIEMNREWFARTNGWEPDHIFND